MIENTENLFLQVSSLIDLARRTVVRHTNRTMVTTYFLIGKYIIDDEQGGFFVNIGERLLRNKKDSSIQNINTLLLLPFSYILNAKSFLEVGYK